MISNINNDDNGYSDDSDSIGKYDDYVHGDEISTLITIRNDDVDVDVDDNK